MSKGSGGSGGAGGSGGSGGSGRSARGPAKPAAGAAGLASAADIAAVSKAASSEAEKKLLVAILEQGQASPNNFMLLMGDVRARAGLSKEEFDKAAHKAADEGKIIMNHHASPSDVSQEKRDSFVKGSTWGTGPFAVTHYFHTLTLGQSFVNKAGVSQDWWAKRK